jgi:glutamate dehydrogenase
VGSRWEALARESFRDDLEWQQRSLTISALNYGAFKSISERLNAWKDQHHILVSRWQVMLAELRSTERTEFSMYSVALRGLLDLAQSTTFNADGNDTV